MACKFICDGCGKEVTVKRDPGGYFPPPIWFSRADEKGGQEACSRECIKIAAKKFGTHDIVIPI